MIRKFFNFLIIVLLAGLTLYLIQGACYRLVEPYAKKRLHLAWGNERSLKVNSFLSKFSLDHFAVSPDQNSYPDSLSEFSAENEYAKKVMSFSRPIRDRFYNFINSQENPLRSYDIDDLGIVKEVVKPGLRRPANAMDVSLGLARREGLPVDFSKGIFVKVIPRISRDVYESKFAKLENIFAFLLQQGLACCLLEVDNADELISKLHYLQLQQANFGEKLFIFAEDDATKFVSVAFASEKIKPRCIILKNPAEEFRFSENTRSWFLGITNELNLQESIRNSLIKNAQANRRSKFVYKSKLAGLLYYDLENEMIPIPSFAMAYLLTCLEKNIDEVGNENEQNILLDSNLTNLSDLDIDITENIILGLDPSVEKLQDALNNEYNFDCPVVREYRLMHADSKELSNVSNRDIVLSLGSSFEEMGENVLLEIADRDPLFYRFYISLKEIQDLQSN